MTGEALRGLCQLAAVIEKLVQSFADFGIVLHTGAYILPGFLLPPLLWRRIVNAPSPILEFWIHGKQQQQQLEKF